MRRTANKINLRWVCFVLAAFLLVLCSFSATLSASNAYAVNGEQGKEYNCFNLAVGEDNCKNYKYVSTFDTVFGQILRFWQVYKGKPVEGALVTVSVDKQGKVSSLNGHYIDIPRFASKTISMDSAVNTVLQNENCGILTCYDTCFYDGSQVFDVYCYATYLDVDGNVLTIDEYPINSKLTPPIYNLNEQQYAFYGWHVKGIDDKSLFNFENTKITQNITFVPIVKLKSYTVLFYTETNDGPALITKMIMKYGEHIILPDNSTVNAKHDGFILEGWYFDPQFSEKAEDFVLTKDVSLYAKWVRDEAYYNKRIIIIVVLSLVIASIIFIPLTIFIIKRRKRF